MEMSAPTERVRMAERSKALRSGRSPVLRAWVRIPLLTHPFCSLRTQPQAPQSIGGLYVVFIGGDPWGAADRTCGFTGGLVTVGGHKRFFSASGETVATERGSFAETYGKRAGKVVGCDGRVVKALDLKSNGIFPRRFKSCSQRTF